MRKSYCIICQKERNGLEVEDDTLISTVRFIKRNVLKNEKGGRLVVCRECYPKYAERRKRFESRQGILLALGVLYIFLGVILSPRLSMIVAAIVFVAFLYILTLLISVPKLKLKREEQ